MVVAANGGYEWHWTLPDALDESERSRRRAEIESFGFYVPTEVLVNDHGDCDSKSAAFAALWRHLDTAVLLISVPRHMLVGVEVRPGPGEAFVRIGNRYFVLCEPAGPAKLHPGAERLSGDFEYMLLEPGRAGDVEGKGSAN